MAISYFYILKNPIGRSKVSQGRLSVKKVRVPHFWNLELEKEKKKSKNFESEEGWVEELTAGSKNWRSWLKIYAQKKCARQRMKFRE